MRHHARAALGAHRCLRRVMGTVSRLARASPHLGHSSFWDTHSDLALCNLFQFQFVQPAPPSGKFPGLLTRAAAHIQILATRWAQSFAAQAT